MSLSSGRCRPRLQRLVRWWTAPLADHPEVRDTLIATVIQRRPAVFISSAAVMIMSLSAALLTWATWAIGWLMIDALLIALRLFLSFRFDNKATGQQQARGAVVGAMLTLFLTFGLGCSLCILRGPPVLVLTAVISVLGVFAGLGWRWAALPRLALATIGVIALPVCLAIGLRTGGGLILAAVQFAAIAAMTASQTAQNHRILLRMVLAEYQDGVLARSDPLTGLGNRVRLREDLSALLRRRPAHADDRAPGVLYIDLDGFKAFNDTNGHEAGDELLRRIGETISAEAGGSGVYRIGGDEFVVIGALCEASALELGQRLVERVAKVQLHPRRATRAVGASIGIAVARAWDEPDAILARADEALYTAKRAGKARCHVADHPAAAPALAA